MDHGRNVINKVAEINSLSENKKTEFMMIMLMSTTLPQKEYLR